MILLSDISPPLGITKHGQTVSRKVSGPWQVANINKYARAPENQGLALPEAHSHQSTELTPIANAHQHPLHFETGEFRKTNFLLGSFRGTMLLAKKYRVSGSTAGSLSAIFSSCRFRLMATGRAAGGSVKTVLPPPLGVAN